MARSIRKRLKVRIVLVLPAYAESFHASAAAFRKACVAKLAIMHDHLAPCLVYHPADCGSRGSCQPLVSLTVVVCAYVEELMVFMVIPLHVLYCSRLRRLRLSLVHHAVKVHHKRRKVCNTFRDLRFMPFA